MRIQQYDNVFPEFLNYEDCSIEGFSEKIKYLQNGDVLEFGVASAQTIVEIARQNPDKRIFGFDHFQGLEQTKKPTPNYAGWNPGAFRVGDPDYPHIPSTIEGVLEKIKDYKNINLVIEDIHNLKDPKFYGINKICAVNIDVDIYEPTVSAFNFIDKCDWEQLYIRFDDWHGHEPDFDHHEKLAAREWLTKNSYSFSLPQNGLHGGMIVRR